MIQYLKLHWRNPATIAWVAIGSFLLLNIVFILLQVMNKFFNPDELQHLHIGWLVAHGDIVYRDFWEHHGPFYSLMNGSIIYLSNAEPSLRILFLSRLLSACALFGVMAVIWHIARQLSFTRLGAFLTVAIFSSLDIIQTRGVEMRPDPIQSLFWIGGLYLLFKNLSNGNLKRPILAGALFSLAILSNAKSGIGPFFVVVFYLAGPWLCDLKGADIWRDLKGMIIGGSLTTIPFVIYFWANDALTDFLYYAFYWNVELAFHWTTNPEFQKAASPMTEISLATKHFRNLLRDQLPLFILFACGAGLFLWQLFKESDPLAKQRYWLLAITTAGTTLGWLLDLYTQFFLIFLPLWSILVSYGLITITNQLVRLNKIVGLSVGSLIALTAAAGMLWASLNKVSLTEHRSLRTQKEFTESFVKMTSRDEPVGMIWNQCGGYMFNPNVGYYWIALGDVSEIIEAMEGEHPHGQSFIDEMEAQQIRYVVGNESWATEGMSKVAMDYLKENFEYSSCLWTRKAK